MKTLNYFKKNIKISHGFTLVETLVAISILTLSILAGFTAVNNGIKSSLTVKNQITAFYLTQEAMELIKNKRDDNALNFINEAATTWLTGMSAVVGDACYFGKTCRIDTIDRAVTDCALDIGGVCINLLQDTVVTSATKGMYGYNGSWTQTNFRRSIQFTSISTDEVRVTITISWTQGATVKTFQVSQSLFNRLQ